MNESLALLCTFFLGLFILLGALIVLLTNNKNKFVQFSIGMAFGVMVTLVVTDLIPEAFELLKSSFSLPVTIFSLLFFSGLGVTLLKVLDHFIPDHDDEDKQITFQNKLFHIGLISSIALILHNIIEGMAIYGTFTNSLKLGLFVSIGVGLHNIPLGMAIASTFYQASGSRKKTILMITLVSLSTFIGGLFMFLFSGSFINNTVLGILLCVTLGMIIYITLFELLPQMKESTEKKMTYGGALFGVLLLLIGLLF